MQIELANKSWNFRKSLGNQLGNILEINQEIKLGNIFRKSLGNQIQEITPIFHRLTKLQPFSKTLEKLKASMLVIWKSVGINTADE